jgi:rhomboid protease GluP
MAPGESMGQALRQMGANQHELVFAQGQVWRLLASMFLHGGELHLLFNMASLFSLGTLLERLAGSGKFLLIYFAAGLLGSLFSAAQPGNPMSVGASGAIFGIAGALLALNYRRPPEFPRPLAERIFGSLIRPVALAFGLGLLISAGGGPVRFDNWAHFGGLFGGAALVLARPSLLQKSLRRRA